MLSRLSFFVCFFAVSISGHTAFATDFYVYFLGGQSNMDGYGYVNELPTELANPQKGIYIFHGNTSRDNDAVDGKGLWTTLQAGHGVGFKSDGAKNDYSARFGVELSFAQAMQKNFPDRRIAIIKYSRGGTSIHAQAAGNYGCWEPDFEGKNGVNQYDHFLATIRNAFADGDIDDDGTPDRLIPAGIAWMQGESDANYSVEIAEQYKDNLKRLMDLIRASLREDDIPVAVGRISYSRKEPLIWKHGEIIRKGQADFVKSDGHAALITATDSYGYSDPAHYDSAGYLDLGKQFADELAKLESANRE